MRKMPNDVERLDRISSAMDADEEGNITAGKDVEIDGKLRLNSLVSNTNPDGDITKALGGGPLYCHCIVLKAGASINYYSSDQTQYTYDTFVNKIRGKYLACSGITDSAGEFVNIYRIHITASQINADYINVTGSKGTTTINKTADFFDVVSQVE